MEEREEIEEVEKPGGAITWLGRAVNQNHVYSYSIQPWRIDK